jgi:tellurite resistance protein
MLDVFGPRVRYRTIGHGAFHCERCGGDREYLHRSGRHWISVFGILPVVPLSRAGEHLRCAECGTCYRVELLAVPTLTQMQTALVAGTTACALAILRAEGSASPAARRRAVDAIRSAGSPEYDDAALVAALTGMAEDRGSTPALRVAVESLSIQLEGHAREWFLARIVRIGLAGGSLGVAQRQVIQTIARHLGMSVAQAREVISLAEEAAQAG